MCIHDQCDTILVSVDQRIIMPPLTSLSVPNKPFSQNTNIASITAYSSLENFPKPVPGPAKPPSSQADPSQARRRGVASGDQGGPGQGVWSVSTAQATVSLLHGPPRSSDTAQAWRREERRRGNQPGPRGAAAAAKGEPRGSVRCTAPRPEHPGQGSLSIHT